MTSQNKKALAAIDIVSGALPAMYGDQLKIVGDALNEIRAALQPAPIDIEAIKRESCKHFDCQTHDREDQIQAIHVKETIDYLASRGLITQKVAEMPGLGDAIEAHRELYERDIKRVEDGNKNFVGMNKNRPKKSPSSIVLEGAMAYHELTQQGENNG